MNTFLLYKSLIVDIKKKTFDPCPVSALSSEVTPVINGVSECVCVCGGESYSSITCSPKLLPNLKTNDRRMGLGVCGHKTHSQFFAGKRKDSGYQKEKKK